jgi:hypothetical protein
MNDDHYGKERPDGALALEIAIGIFFATILFFISIGLIIGWFIWG